MSLVNSGSHPRRLEPGVHSWFGEYVKSYPTQYTEIFKVEQSDRRYEDDVGLVGFGLATRKDEGDAVSMASFNQGYAKRYQHVTYGIGFIITDEALADDQYSMNLAQKGARNIARSMLQTKELIGANVLNNGFSSSYLGGDGKALLATDHPLMGGGGTFANKPSVDLDLSEAALEQANIDIAAWVDDAGLKIAQRPVKLIIPANEMFNAERILNSPARVATADNDLNALKSMGKNIPVVVNNYLTDTDAWFLITDADDGLKHFVRKGYAIASDNDFLTGNARFKATERYSFGWTDPRCVYGSQGA